MRLVFLGTGTSFGVPQIGCDCATCTSPDPRDRRTRCAVLIDTGAARLLIDTPPELRLQLVGAGVTHLDAVLFTHAHADHVHGIDDLRAFSLRGARPLPAYGPAETIAELVAKFPYIFDAHGAPPPGSSRPELVGTVLEGGVPADIAGVPVLPIALSHGVGRVFGYRIGSLAYLTDVKAIPAELEPALAGLDVLVLNALLSRPHPLHLSVPEAVAAAQRIGARRTFLTHLTHEQTHVALAARLPPGVAPAYDGLVVEVGGL